MNYQQLASKGRYGDTELYNINRRESALLKALGGSGTINPNTGLREYSFLGDIWNQTLGNEGLGGYFYGGQIIDDTNNLWNNTLGNQGLGGYIGGGQAGTDLYNMIGGVDNWLDNSGLSNAWNQTIGNQGLGGTQGVNMIQDFGSNLWNQTLGNEGLGGWIGDVTGLGQWEPTTLADAGWGGVGPGWTGGSSPSEGSPVGGPKPPGWQPGGSPLNQRPKIGNPAGSGGWGGFSGNTQPPRNPYNSQTSPSSRPGMQGRYR